MTVIKRRRPWIAGLANLALAPIGHVYAGAPRRGILAVLSCALVLGVGLMMSVHAGSRATLLVGIGLLVVPYVALAADAYVLARKAGEQYQLQWFNRWYAYGLVVLGIAFTSEVVQSTVRRDLAQAYRIPSNAMVPTLVVGDHLLVDKRAYRSGEPQRGDIIVFEYPVEPEKDFIKRIVGLPGESLELRDKVVWLNGARLEEPYAAFAEGASGKLTSPRDNLGPFEIPAGSYFVLGDNRDRSYDSRYWGFVERDKIKGRARVIYFSGIPWTVRWDRIGMTLR